MVLSGLLCGRTPLSLLKPLPAIGGLLCGAIRHKTFVRKPTKANKKYLKYVEKCKAEGVPFPKYERNVTETKFFKVLGNMKIYKPVSPGTRNRRQPIRFHLHRGGPVSRLSFGKRSTGGRNHTGKITIRHRGGGHKRRVRSIDFYRSIPGAHEVVRLEYDPNRTADLALLRHTATNEFSYMVRPADLNPGDTVYSWRSGISEEELASIPRNKLLQVGNCLKLKDIPIGTTIHAIAIKRDGPAQFCRSAGTSAVLIAKSETMAQIRLTSKEVRLVSLEACATIGVVGNENHKLANLGKAGAKRRKGIRPTVRGIAMNAVDHPHGGGKKSKGGKAPRSPWGWKTKGPKSVRKKRWFIVTPRWKAKKMEAR